MGQPPGRLNTVNLTGALELLGLREDVLAGHVADQLGVQHAHVALRVPPQLVVVAALDDIPAHADDPERHRQPPGRHAAIFTRHRRGRKHGTAIPLTWPGELPGLPDWPLQLDIPPRSPSPRSARNAAAGRSRAAGAFPSVSNPALESNLRLNDCALLVRRADGQ